MKKAIIAILVTATVALAFIQIDDTHVQTVLTGAIKTFQDAIRFQATGGGSQYVGIVGPAVVNTPSVTYKLPQNDGTAGQALTTDGSANLSFSSFAGPTPPTPVPTATPQPIVTPVPTDTPLIDLLYSGKLNLGANAAATPLGRVTITANATPAPHDRVIICVNGTATPTPLAYTMPAATGSGRVIDMIVGGSQVGGGGPCIMDAGTDFMNNGHTNLITTEWGADTCYDMAVGQWACRNLLP